MQCKITNIQIKFRGSRTALMFMIWGGLFRDSFWQIEKSRELTYIILFLAPVLLPTGAG
jgi:hypothetical protein